MRSDKTFEGKTFMTQKNVLVVEDNALNLKLVKSLLELGGYQVSHAFNAEDGIEYLRSQKPDLVLMDIQLPGMNGLTATRIIKEGPETKDIPVIGLSSYAMQGDDQKALDAGCDGYITKPIDTRNFLKTIGGFLLNHSASPVTGSKQITHMPRVLIVDDDLQNVKLMKAKLQNRGYELLEAYSGEDALKKVETSPPDLILLDIMMPGIDGYEVVKRLRKEPKNKDVPIIMVTALDGMEDKIRGFEAGADEFLTKPVNSVELLARIKSMLRMRQFQEQLSIRAESEAHFGGSLLKKAHVADPISSQRVLVVEDDERDIKLIRNFLNGENYELIVAQTGEEALSIIFNEKIDLVLLDILLPGMDGFELCQRLRETDKTKDIQIVIISCLSDLETRLRGLEEGVDDYLVKPINCREINARVNALLKKKAYLDKLHSHYEMALNSAINDGLTGLFNHSYFKRFLDLEVKKSVRQAYPISLLMMDLDDFKKYNDTLGHVTGDIILSEVSRIIKENIREIDFAARYGGEEFAVVLPYAGEQSAMAVAGRIKESIRSHTYQYEASLEMKRITISMGLACCPSDAHTANELIQMADSMLLQAKQEGKDRICVCK